MGSSSHTHKKPVKKVIYFIYGPHSYNYNNNNVTLSTLCDKEFAEKTSYPTYDSVNAAVNREGITTQLYQATVIDFVL